MGSNDLAHKISINWLGYVEKTSKALMRTRMEVKPEHWKELTKF